MSTSPEQVVDSFLAAIEAQDLDAALALVSDDCVYDNVPIGSVTGPDEMRGVLARMVEGSDEVVWDVHRQSASGAIVFNERSDRFRHGDQWLDLPVTGVWEVHDGRITLWRDYFDLRTYTDQKAALG